MKHLFACWLIWEAMSLAGILAQSPYQYKVDLASANRDRVPVSLQLNRPIQESLAFQFPKTVPGTYAILDYGRFVKKIEAYDASGKKLKIEKQAPNVFVIQGPGTLAKIGYDFQDTWEHGGKPKIFEPAGCGFEEGQYFAINGGMFGFLAGEENLGFEFDYLLPPNMRGYSSLEGTDPQNGIQTFKAPSYHAVIDHPLLFTKQAAAVISVAGTEVSIATQYDLGGASEAVKQSLTESMEAIEKFVGQTLVDRYSYLLYFDNQDKAGKILAKASEKGRLGLWRGLRLIPHLIGQGYGALEHGTSSMYFMPAFDAESYTDGLEEVAIHEFMHIYTPLSLHSEMIGDFDYVNPQMSQHLWLYEGITEYFAGLIQQQGGLVTLLESLNDNWRAKIRAGSSYPDSIPFTVMSANVFDDPYEELYGHVYDRGAIMGMLLDFEIMHLTQGEKTLKDVVFRLCEHYGADQSFDEASFVETFVAEVHPELQTFFDRFVTGKEPLDLEGGFEKVGIRYEALQEGPQPVNLLSSKNDVKTSFNLLSQKNLEIQEVGPNDVVGFQPGDKISSASQILEAYYHEDSYTLKPEGATGSLTVIRDGVPVTLTFPLPYEEGTRSHVITPLPLSERSELQQKLFKLWVEGR
ncbi:MAG: hypothetical protein AAF804_02610 [Bacteroidota bacterium]